MAGIGAQYVVAHTPCSSVRLSVDASEFLTTRPFLNLQNGSDEVATVIEAARSGVHHARFESGVTITGAAIAENLIHIECRPVETIRLAGVRAARPAA